MLSLLLALATSFQAPPPFPAAAVTELRAGWRFAVGDSAVWARPGHPDGTWHPLAAPAVFASLGFPGYRGYAWYRYRYQVDSAVTEPMGLRVQSIIAAYEVFVDGRRIGGFGDFPPRYRPRSDVPLTFAVPAAALAHGEHVIAVRVYSDERAGGIELPVLAGPMDSLRDGEQQLSAFLLGSAFLLLGLAITQLFFWARRPETTEHLSFFGFVVALALLFILGAPPVRAAVGERVDVYRLYLLFSGLAGALFCFSIQRSYDLEHGLLLTVLGAVLTTVGLVGVMLPGWDEQRAAGRYLLNPALAVVAVTVTVVAVQQVRRGGEHARTLLWGIGILAVTLVHDLLADWGLTRPNPGTPWLLAGAVLFVLVASFVTTRKIVDAVTIALNDRLTGLYRREVVLDALKREIRRAARTHQPLALIMMDLDRFKTVNDSLGHQAGDRVLGEVGRRLAEAGRAVDWLCRYGGEEFLAVLAGSPEEGARLAAERFRSAVGSLPIDAGRTARSITISAGISVYDGGPEWPTVETLVGAADAAMYRAKEAGRNQVSS